MVVVVLHSLLAKLTRHKQRLSTWVLRAHRDVSWIVRVRPTQVYVVCAAGHVHPMIARGSIPRREKTTTMPGIQ